MGSKPKSSVRIIVRRTVAWVLVLAMLGTGLLHQRTNVAIDAGSMENRGARVAAQELTAPDTYAGSSRLQRMGTYARSLLSRLERAEDCDRAAQIAIARTDYDSALLYTERAIELYDGTDEGLANLDARMGYLYTLQANYKDALKWLDKGLSLMEIPAARLTRAQVRLNLGDPKGALTDVETWSAGTEIPWQMMPYLVNIYVAAGEYWTATDLYTTLIEATGEPEYMLNRAYCYTTLGSMEEAEADCAGYAEAGGSEIAQAQVMLGIGWMRSGNYDKAGTCFGQALEQGYPDPEVLYYYVVLCAYVTGDEERACTYGDQMIGRIRAGDEARSADVQMEDTTGRLNVSLVPLDESSLCMMTGACHMRLGQYDDAVDCLTLCLERSPENGFARYLRASCLLASNRFEEAVKDFDAAIEAGEDEEKCRYGRAVCRIQLGDEAGALEDFDWVMLHGKDDSLFTEASKLMQALLGETDTSVN